jgi:hypothetical protein
VRPRRHNGIALDIPVRGGPGNPACEELERQATASGFVRAVGEEPRHREFELPGVEVGLATGAADTLTVGASFVSQPASIAQQRPAATARWRFDRFMRRCA